MPIEELRAINQPPDKISRRFQQIERVELEHPETVGARLLDSDD